MSVRWITIDKNWKPEWAKCNHLPIHRRRPWSVWEAWMGVRVLSQVVPLHHMNASSSSPRSTAGFTERNKISIPFFQNCLFIKYLENIYQIVHVMILKVPYVSIFVRKLNKLSYGLLRLFCIFLYLFTLIYILPSRMPNPMYACNVP